LEMRSTADGQYDASVVIIHYGNERLTSQCVKSVIEDENSCRYQIIVVNNGPQTALQLGNRLPGNLRVINLSTNVGYASAVNIGCASAQSKTIVVLNNDVTVQGKCISNLVSTLERNSKVGFCAPIKYNMDNPNILDGAGGMINLLLQTWDHCSFEYVRSDCLCQRELPYPPGAAYAIRKDIATLYGKLLDEDFFMYFDDPDVGMRSFYAGYVGMLVPSSVVYHKRGASSGTYSTLAHFYFSRNMLISIFKNLDTLTFLKLIPSYLSYILFRIANSILALKGRAGRQTMSICVGALSGLLALKVAKYKKPIIQSIKKARKRSDSQYFELFSEEAMYFSEEPPSALTMKAMGAQVKLMNLYSRLARLAIPQISQLSFVCQGRRTTFCLV